MARTSLEGVQFLSAAEVAEKLKLNPQVVARKLQTGEIPGYKIGKDWRVAEDELLAWLQSRSNQRRVVGDREKVERSFFRDGKLKEIPAQRRKRRFVLERLLEEFELSRVYSETEVNDILRRFHSDVCTLRREFILEKMMTRSSGKYTRCSSYISKPSTALPPKDSLAALRRKSS
jgi:excisionase family DNA binding protein